MDELTPSEQAEYDRQVKEEQHPKYHSEIKCGLPLIIQIEAMPSYGKRYFIRRKFCQVHEVKLSLTGWEKHYALGIYTPPHKKPDAERSISEGK